MRTTAITSTKTPALASNCLWTASDPRSIGANWQDSSARQADGYRRICGV